MNAEHASPTRPAPSLGQGSLPGGLHWMDPTTTPDWDNRLQHNDCARFFHSAAWARVLHATYGYQPVYLTRLSGNRIDALLPLMEVNSWLTGRRGISLPFTDAVEPLGPDPGSLQALFALAKARGQERGWKYLECRGGRPGLAEAPAATEFFCHTLDLTVGEPALMSRCENSVRRAIKRGDQSGLTLEFSREPAAMDGFYRLLCQTRKRLGVPPQPFSFFARICEYVLAPGHGWVVLAKRGAEPVAGAVFFHFGRHALYKFGASNPAFQQLRGNNAVMWQAIRRYAAEGFATLDFGRTSLGNEGLRRFKLGWGTHETTTGYIRYDLKAGRFVTTKDESAGWHNHVFRHLPQPLARIAGNLLYRHIA